MNTDNQNTFRKFLKHQKEYFTTTEEQDVYHQHLEGLNTHINGILNLIFNDTEELTDEEYKYYQNLLLKSFTGASKDNEQQDTPVEEKAHSQPSQSKFYNTLSKFVDLSTK